MVNLQSHFNRIDGKTDDKSRDRGSRGGNDMAVVVEELVQFGVLVPICWDPGLRVLDGAGRCDGLGVHFSRPDGVK